MKKYIGHAGIFSVCLGVVVLAVSFMTKLTGHNWISFLALVLIIGGSVFHFRQIKRKSKY